MQPELLAAKGLVGGVYQYYLKPYVEENPAVVAWGVLGAGVVGFNILSSPGNTLSECADRAIEKHPLPTRLAIGAVALHLANLIPERWDVIHQTFRLMKGRA